MLVHLFTLVQAVDETLLFNHEQQNETTIPDARKENFGNLLRQLDTRPEICNTCNRFKRILICKRTPFTHSTQ